MMRFAPFATITIGVPPLVCLGLTMEDDEFLKRIGITRGRPYMRRGMYVTGTLSAIQLLVRFAMTMRDSLKSSEGDGARRVRRSLHTWIKEHDHYLLMESRE